MIIKIYPIKSSLHSEELIKEQTNQLIKELEKDNHKVELVDSINNLYKKTDLSLILVQSGGSEGEFLKIKNKLKSPFYLLTYGSNNSLAASLEILTYLNNSNLSGEVLHGSYPYIRQRINDILENIQKHKTLYSEKEDKNSRVGKPIKPDRLGVIGKPSDWLISSNVDYLKALETFKVELVDISINNVIKMYEDKYKQINNDPSFSIKNLNLCLDNIQSLKVNDEEIKKAYVLYLVLQEVCQKHKLTGFTIRCFSFLDTIKTTSCLALALFNSNNNEVCSCEGDIPSLLGMHIVRKVLKKPVFQANPSYIDPTMNEIILAHCTLPLSMCNSYNFDTHFESDSGVGIHGELKEGPITVFRISSNLQNYFIEDANLIKNMYSKSLCRTQIKIQMNDLDVILKHPLGNHLLVCYGHNKSEIEHYFNLLGMKKINK